MPQLIAYYGDNAVMNQSKQSKMCTYKNKQKTRKLYTTWTHIHVLLLNNSQLGYMHENANYMHG